MKQINHNRNRRGEHSVDRNIHYCLLCKRCWEVSTLNEYRSKTEYYKDFPTLGRERKMCSFCKKKEKNARTT